MTGLDELHRIRFDPNVILASATANMLGMALPITMIQIYDRVIPNAGYETLSVLAIGVLSAIVAEAIIRIARGALLTRAGSQFEAGVYEQALYALTEAPTPETAARSSGELSNKLRSIDKVRAHYCSDAAASLLDIPFIGIFLVMMLAISPHLGATIFAFVLLVFAVVRLTRKRNIALSKDREISDTRRQSFLVQTLFGIEFIKSLGIEDLMERRYERLMSGGAPVGAKMSAQIQLNQGLIAVVGLLAPVVTTSVGAYLVITGAMSVGGLAASVLLTGRIIQPVLRIEAYLGGQDAIRIAETDLLSILATPGQSSHLSEQLIAIDHVELKNIHWHPSPSAPPVFEDVSLSLTRGDCISIEGGEGSGKSSLLALLSGRIPPTSGEVCINQRSISEYARSEIHQKMSILTRENGLLDGTLMENLTGFKGEAHAEKAISLTHELGIDKFIEKHSSGLGMRVYSGGKSGLPNAIADSVVMIGGLASQPDVILFDEANSRLDAEQDIKLQEYLGKLQPNVIMVLITHRPSYLKLAARHFELKDGHLRQTKGISPLDLNRHGKRCA